MVGSWVRLGLKNEKEKEDGEGDGKGRRGVGMEDASEFGTC